MRSLELHLPQLPFVNPQYRLLLTDMYLRKLVPTVQETWHLALAYSVRERVKWEQRDVSIKILYSF